MWKLGNLNIEGKVVLAPMAGITSVGYRNFMVPFGVSACVTEMVSDMGLIYENDETKEYLNFSNNAVPTGVQLFGHDPINLAKSAQIALKLNNNIAFFDINMGCPVPKVTKTGAGSTLMNNPILCGDIIREIKKVTNLPITAKIRLGWDDKSVNFLEVINELEKAGIDAIAIHARTRSELYSGSPHYDLLKDLRKRMHVPLIVSGNIFSLEDAIEAISVTGAEAVMVARGGMGNPFLITQIDHYFKTGEKLPDPTMAEQVKWCLELGQSLINFFGESRAMRIYRSIAPKFFSGFPGAKTIKTRLATELTDFDSLKAILQSIVF
ncbi:MAG TPA: tRNA dihydrouridine synthase DusB [Bacilli bacterium]|nr:tRNA dihydrouridine synthase DusB [Bacilli bacterium]